MAARDAESALLARCVVVAREAAQSAQDQREANVFRLAGMILSIRYPEAGQRLFAAATTYFAEHPEQQLPSAEIVRRGWIINAPRLRDRLGKLFTNRFWLCQGDVRS